MIKSTKLWKVLILMMLMLPHFECLKELPTIPNQPPSVTIVGPKIISTQRGGANFQWYGTDNDGRVIEYRYKLNCPIVATAQWSQWCHETSRLYTILPNGGYLFQVQAKDDNGDTSKVATKPFVVKINIPPENALVVDDFDSYSSRRNKLGGARGVRTSFPGDPTQGVIEILDDTVKYGRGRALRLIYDVDSPNQAMNGYFFYLDNDTLKTQDLTSYTRLVLFVKGDQENGFTTKFQIELRRLEEVNKAEAVCFVITGVNSLWQQFVLLLDDFRPFNDFHKITNWSTISELRITFSDYVVDQDKKEGVIFLDDIYFE